MDGYGKRVLVVDDDEPTRLLMGLALERDGYTVFPARDGLEALHEVTKRHFDVVVTDFAMPTLNGLQLLGRIHGVAPGTPVILVSGSLPDIRTTAGGSGFFACLRKPFELAGLLELVREAARLRGPAASQAPAPHGRDSHPRRPAQRELMREG